MTWWPSSMTYFFVNVTYWNCWPISYVDQVWWWYVKAFASYAWQNGQTQLDHPHFLPTYAPRPSLFLVQISLKLYSNFYGNRISCKLESYSGGKTWQPEMGSPKRKFKISETTGPILLKFTGHIGPGMVFWSIKYRDWGLKFDGDRQQTKFTFLNFQKFVSPTILKTKF